MSNQIQPQVDVGALSIQGLGAIRPLLAILSADNVTPVAVDQMCNLGSLFHINGPDAHKVSDMLRRFSSQPIIRHLAVEVGWRRGDTASLMAESTGGQAIALLSACLVNLFGQDKTGIILHTTSNSFLPETMNISSIMQLRDVAALLASKLNAMGFGNHLARQVVRIHDVYKQLQIDAPKDLLCALTNEAMVDLLGCLIRIHSEESGIVRITGSGGMGYIIGLILFMFPDSTSLTVESFVVHEGPHRSIQLELIGATNPIQVRTEERLTVEPIVELPIGSIPNSKLFGCSTTCTFTWRGWVADELQLWFSSYSANCTEKFLVACSNLVVAAAPEIGPQRFHIGKYKVQDQSNDHYSTKTPRDGIQAMLGQLPRLRMERICETVLRASPSEVQMNVADAVSALRSIFEDATKHLQCRCCEEYDRESECRYWQGKRHTSIITCPRKMLWNATVLCLSDSLVCLLIDENVGPNVSVRSDDLNIFTSKFFGTNYFESSPDEICSQLFKNFFLPHNQSMLTAKEKGGLVQSSGSTTILPQSLRTLEMHPSMLRTFELVEGQLLFKGRQFLQLNSDVASMKEYPYKEPVLDHEGSLMPSSCGVHSDLYLTVRESLDHLVLMTTVRYRGQDIRLSLGGMLVGCYYLLFATEPCHHPHSTALDQRYRSEVIAASVVAPEPPGSICVKRMTHGTSEESDKIGFVMTKSDRTAQLLACRKGFPTLLIRDCCLNCAFEQAKEHGIRLVITT